MLQWVSRLLGQGPAEPAVLGPDETPHDEVEVAAKGPDGLLGNVTVVLTRKRLLLTNKTHTTTTLSIPLTDVMGLESTGAGIRIAYRDSGGVDQDLWLGHVLNEEGLVWMGDDSWVQSVAARIMEETGRDVWREADSPWYRRGA